MKPENEIYAQRMKKARRLAWFEALVINASLLAYFIFGLYYLFAYIEAQETLASVSLVQSWVWGTLSSGALLGFLWTFLARSPGRILIERTNKVLKGQYRPSTKPFYKTASGFFGIALLLLTLVLGTLITETSVRALLSAEGVEGAGRIFKALVEPNTTILGMVLEAMLATIFIALMSTAIALPISFILSFLSARNLMKGHFFSRLVYTVVRFICNFTRSVEPLIWAIIFSVWVGVGPFAGMLSLMLHSVASLVKQYSEVIEDIDHGPIEAIEATGANALQVVAFAVVPQIILPFLSFTIYRWDINIRMATIIGMVGGGGVGTLLMQYQGLARWNEVGTIIIIIAIVVWVMDYLTARIREAIY